MPAGINFPGSLDTATQLPDVGASDHENLNSEIGLYHDELLTNFSRAILALEALVGAAPAGTHPLVQQLTLLRSQLAQLQALANENRLNVSALQQQPVWDDSLLLPLQSRVDALAAQIAALLTAPASFDESRLLSRDARMDAMASQIAVLLTAPAATGTVDPLQTHLVSEAFGS